MHDCELYRRILGIQAPWFVDAVELKLEDGEVHIRLVHHDLNRLAQPGMRASRQHCNGFRYYLRVSLRSHLTAERSLHHQSEAGWVKMQQVIVMIKG